MIFGVSDEGRVNWVVGSVGVEDEEGTSNSLPSEPPVPVVVVVLGHVFASASAD